MARGRVHELRYLVEIPIPFVNRRGDVLERGKRLRWRRRLETALTECFGGFTPAKAPAMNRVQTASGAWMTLTEKGQVVLRSACADRDAFLAHRERLDGRHLRTVRDGVLYRSAQLPTSGLGRAVKDLGIRTVVSLRDADRAADQTEERYCAEKGSTNIRKPPDGTTRSSSAGWSSISNPYLKPLQPPG